jgi:hypothetical protein
VIFDRAIEIPRLLVLGSDERTADFVCPLGKLSVIVSETAPNDSDLLPTAERRSPFETVRDMLLVMYVDGDVVR